MGAMSEERPASRRFLTISLTCASLTVALGLMTFIGWISAMPLLASVRANYIPMAPSTALCFAMIASGLLIQVRRPDWRLVPRILATLVLVMAAAKLIEIIGGFRFGIDAWFVRNPGKFGAVPTGRMATMTALTFVFTATGLLGMTGKHAGKWVGAAGALVAVIGTVILAGYWYGTPLLYGGTIIPVALPTACGFLLCGTCIMTAIGAGGWPLRVFLGDSTSALLLRSFVPVVIAAALINGWVNTTLLKNPGANPAVISALCAIVFAVLITWIVSQVARVVGGRIDRAEAERNLAQSELIALNAELESRVVERTRELLEKNQQMHEELQMARELQTALLPRSFPTIPPNVTDQESALKFLSLYFPTGDVSGDFFSVVPVGEKAVGVFICDVMGHGVRSALITSMIRGLVEEHVSFAADPGELLTRINRALALILKQADTTMFATCFYVVADVENSELRFANAGHPCAFHIKPGEAGAEKLEGSGRRGPAMGLFPTVGYVTSSTPLAEGDLIMLFTDGLFEVEDAAGNLFSEEQLQDTVSRHSAQTPEIFFESVLAEVRAFSQRESFDDDVCVVGMKFQHRHEITSHPDAALVGKC